MIVLFFLPTLRTRHALFMVSIRMEMKKAVLPLVVQIFCYASLLYVFSVLFYVLNILSNIFLTNSIIYFFNMGKLGHKEWG